MNQTVAYLLRSAEGTLYALLDAARDGRIARLLDQSPEEHASLYEGPQGEELAEVAPYLVRLEPHSPLLAELLRRGWGNAWGLYLFSEEPFRLVRRHFRHFLKVRTEEGRELYFRFYDPRVLRVFLPTCRPDEVLQLFGPVTRFVVEGTDASKALIFSASPAGLHVEERSLLHLSASEAQSAQHHQASSGQDQRPRGRVP